MGKIAHLNKQQGSTRKGSKRIEKDQIVDPFLRRVKGLDQIIQNDRDRIADPEKKDRPIL